MLFNSSVMKNRESKVSRVYGPRVVNGILFVLFATFMVGDCWSQQISAKPTGDEIQTDSISLSGNSNGIAFSFLNDGNTNSHNEFQFVFGNGIVATLDSDVAGLFAQRLGCLYGKRGTNKVGERYPKPKSKDDVLVATFDEGFIGANGKIYKSEKEYNYDPNTNIWISLDEFGKYPPHLGGMNKLVLK
jgi:hypothetical protein